jgi:hypothetical protein
MLSHSVQIEREVEETRRQLSRTLEELQNRVSPGLLVEKAIDYARDSTATNLVRNLGWEVVENPTPLVVIGIGIAWLMFASGRTSRVATTNGADVADGSAEKIRTPTSAAVSTTEGWGRQTAGLFRDRASNIACVTDNGTAEILNRLRDVADGLAERAGAGGVTGKSKDNVELMPNTDPAVGTRRRCSSSA